MLRRIFLVMIVLAMSSTVLLSANKTFAHTPSPPICNDPICNVDIHDNFFSPNDLTIRPPNNVTGESVKVVWVNHGSLTHTVTSGPPGSPDGLFDVSLLSGQNYTLTVNYTIFTAILNRYPSGNQPYYCALHYTFGMTANLDVNPNGDPIPEFSSLTLLLTTAVVTSFVAVVLSRTRKRTTP